LERGKWRFDSDMGEFTRGTSGSGRVRRRGSLLSAQRTSLPPAGATPKVSPDVVEAMGVVTLDELFRRELVFLKPKNTPFVDKIDFKVSQVRVCGGREDAYWV
jgi:hypothetical protein